MPPTPSSRTRRILLWLVPAVVVIHNVEQWFNIRETMAAARTGMPRLLRIIIPPVPSEQYVTALVLGTMLVFAVALMGKIDRERSWGFYALMGIQMALFLNVAAHVAASLVMDSYTAGLVTALGVVLPVSVLLFWSALRRKWISPGAFLLLIPLGVFIHVPMFFGLLFFSGFIARWLHGTG